MSGPEPAAAPEPVAGAHEAANEERQPEALASATVVDVEAELQAALAKAAEHYELYLRAVAETENTRRRAQEDVAKAHKYGIESFAEALVPVAERLEKAIGADSAPPEGMLYGVDLSRKQVRAR